jgi:hypothetical protein
MKMENINAPPPDPLLDKRLQDFLRRPYIEFVRIDTETECTAVAQFFLSHRGATHQDFAQKTGIKLLSFLGHYMECGAALGPTGPIFPGPVKPVLRFKMSRRGNWVYHNSMKHAWVKTDVWEKLVEDDTYFEEVFLGQKKKRGQKKNAKRKKTK